MKKYIIILAALTMGMVSCSKVETENAETNLPATGLTTLTATIPAFTTTKAAVDTDGNFTWKNGDGILVECNATAGGTKEVTFYYNETTQKFSADLATEGCTSVKENATAKYPAVEPASSQIWSSIGETFKMTGTVNASGVIEFTHQSALVHLVFNNVPSFAKAIKVTNGTEEVTADLNGTSGKIATNIPLTPGVGTSIVINLLDNNDNIIVSKKKTASVAAGTIYSTPEINVGHVITVTNEAGWANPSLYIWNGSDNAFLTTTYNYPYKLNPYPGVDNKYYIVLNTSDYSWASEGAGLGFKFQTYDNSSNTQTDCVYLYRDIDFVVPTGGGMKTNYRTYYRIVGDNGKQYWGNTTQVHIKVDNVYDTKSPFDMTALSGVDYMYYYENSADNYGKWMSYEFTNGNGWFVPVTDSNWDYWYYQLNREYIYDANI